MSPLRELVILKPVVIIALLMAYAKVYVLVVSKAVTVDAATRTQIFATFREVPK